MITRQGEVVTSIEFLSGKFDEMSKQMAELKDLNGALKKENNALKIEVTKLQRDVQHLERYNRGQNLEISGIPEKPDEDIRTVVTNVLRRVDGELRADDVDISHRVGPTTPTDSAHATQTRRTRSILVRFTSRRVRNKIYDQRRSLKEVKLADLGLGFRESSNIFINENLTPEMKQLLYKANVARKDKHHRFLWTQNGKILVKKSPDAPAVLIATEADLAKIQ